jgi:signal transduction histidine kinase
MASPAFLVVENDQAVAGVVCRRLERHGRARVASTINEARQAIEERPWSAVVVDVRLPDGSGLEWLASVRAMGVRTPALVLTAFDDIDVQSKAANLGARFSLKPWRHDLLDTFVAWALDGESQRVEQQRGGELSMDERRELIARAVEAAELERRRIARDLHDGIQQRLSYLLVELRCLENELPDERTRSRVEALRNSTREIAHEVNRVARGLYPTALLRRGLAALIEDEVTDVAELCGLRRSTRIEVSQHTLSTRHQAAFYRILQEALRNVVRHAAATSVSVALKVADHAVLTIEDDGRGFDVHTVVGGGIGLRSIRERVEALGGELDITSSGRGTIIRVQLPLGDNTPDSIPASFHEPPRGEGPHRGEG